MSRADRLLAYELLIGLQVRDELRGLAAVAGGEGDARRAESLPVDAQAVEKVVRNRLVGKDSCGKDVAAAESWQADLLRNEAVTWVRRVEPAPGVDVLDEIAVTDGLSRALRDSSTAGTDPSAAMRSDVRATPGRGPATGAGAGRIAEATRTSGARRRTTGLGNRLGDTGQ